MPATTAASNTPRYTRVKTLSGETAHLCIKNILRDEGHLLLDGYVEHRKGRRYLSEKIFAQLYFTENTDEYHKVAMALRRIKGDCRVELKNYTPAEWSNITHGLDFNYEADKAVQS